MKAIVYPEYGTPDVLEAIELPIPKVNDREILVKVSFASVNPIDWKIGEGRLKTYFDFDFPLIVGRDLSGFVVQVGNGVKGFSPGDKVLATLPRPGGALAEYVVLSADHAAKAPIQLTLQECSAIPLCSLTCWQALIENAKIRGEDTVFILSGAGGTGSLAIQLARAKGATAITTCSPSNLEYVKSLGANYVYDYSDENLFREIRARFPEGLDIVFSNALGNLHKHSYSIIKTGGVLITIGEELIPTLGKKHGVSEIDLVARPNGKQLQEIVQLFDDGILKPPAITEFPVADCAKAMRQNMRGHSRGKVVLRF